MGPGSEYMPAQDAPWYHYSTGSLVADAAIGIVADSATAAYGGMNSRIFNPQAKGVRGLMGKAMSPVGLLDDVSKKTGADFSRYFKGTGTPGSQKQFMQFSMMRDAHRGTGAFSQATGTTGFARLSDVMGGRGNAAKMTSRAGLTIGVRSAWTALNFGLGLAAGRGIGSMIANYESHKDNDIQLESGGHFADTQGSFTQRQRSLEVIHNSQLTTRSALGNEASFLHANGM